MRWSTRSTRRLFRHFQTDPPASSPNRRQREPRGRQKPPPTTSERTSSWNNQNGHGSQKMSCQQTYSGQVQAHAVRVPLHSRTCISAGVAERCERICPCEALVVVAQSHHAVPTTPPSWRVCACVSVWAFVCLCAAVSVCPLSSQLCAPRECGITVPVLNARCGVDGAVGAPAVQQGAAGRGECVCVREKPFTGNTYHSPGHSAARSATLHSPPHFQLAII